MLLVASFLLAVLTVPIFGGHLTRLADAQFRRSRLLIAALGLQVLVISLVPGGPQGIWSGVHVATYGMLGWVLAGNRRLPGMAMLAVGGSLNLAAMLANGGVMPATATALRTAGLTTDGSDFVNSGVVTDARLTFLGDIFAMPTAWPLANVFSVGDVLIALGGWWTVQALCGSRARSGSGDSRAGQTLSNAASVASEAHSHPDA